VIADANFPAESVGSHTPAGVVRADGHSIPDLLNGVLQLLPLDDTCPPCALMQVMPEHVDAGIKTPIWDEYRRIVNRSEGRAVEFEEVERFAFYERAKRAFCVVATGETALYGNIILKKGVLGPESDDGFAVGDEDSRQ